jgi:hypothetical protein
METLLHLSSYVEAAPFSHLIGELFLARQEFLPLINCDREAKRHRLITDDEYRPLCRVSTRYQAIEVDEWDPTLHRQPETDILAMLGIRAPILVLDQTARAHLVFIRARLSLHDGCRCDAERNLGENRRFEDPLRAHERDARTSEGESLDQDLSRQRVAVSLGLFLEELEGLGSYRCIDPFLLQESASI